MMILFEGVCSEEGMLCVHVVCLVYACAFFKVSIMQLVPAAVSDSADDFAL